MEERRGGSCRRMSRRRFRALRVAIALAAVGGAVIRRRRAPTVIAAIGPLLTLLACSASAPSTIHCEHVLAYAVAPSPQRSRGARNTSHDAPGRLRFAPPSCTALAEVRAP